MALGEAMSSEIMHSFRWREMRTYGKYSSSVFCRSVIEIRNLPNTKQELQSRFKITVSVSFFAPSTE